MNPWLMGITYLEKERYTRDSGIPLEDTILNSKLLFGN
jgi:hypothetical protein